MIIKSISFKDSNNGIILNDISFDSFSVLVGTSGSGKTTIINSIDQIIDIARGYSSPGIKWTIKFETLDGDQVVWSGEFSKHFFEEDDELVAELVEEELVLNDKTILLKNDSKITYNEQPLPALDKFKSVFYTLRDDELISELHDLLISITLISNDSIEYTQSHMFTTLSENLENGVKEVYDNTLKNPDYDINSFSFGYVLGFLNIDCRRMLYFASIYDAERYDEFSFLYTTIFPTVKEIRPTLMQQTEDEKLLIIKLIMQDDTIISQADISSGMFKVLMILAEIFFGNMIVPIVIDEIENSLGVNCLADVLDELESSDRQIIITTHHPKVINTIPPEHWKIVTRDNGAVKATKATEIIDSKSNHDTFIQLLNSKLYNGSM